MIENNKDSLVTENLNNTEKKKISIIIPVYNNKNFILDCLNSIENQTIGLENLEVIMINDGSTDGVHEIIDNYASKYPNFIAIHLNKNSGSPGHPRNQGIKSATGDYIMFIDSDDYYELNACEVLYNAITKRNSDMAIGKLSYTFQDGNKTISGLYQYLCDELYCDKISECKILFTLDANFTARIYKRDVILNNDIYFPENLKIAEDEVFVTHYLFKANGITFTDNIVYNYRIFDNEGYISTSNHCDLSYFEQLAKSRNMIYDIFYKYGDVNDFNPRVNYCILQLRNTKFLNNEEKKKAAKLLQEVFISTNYIRAYSNNNQYHNIIIKCIIEDKLDDAVVLLNYSDEMDIIIKENQKLQQEKIFMEDNFNSLINRFNELQGVLHEIINEKESQLVK